MTDQMGAFHTVKDMATRLKVVPKTILRWIEQGDLVAHRFNGRIRVSEADLQAFLRRHRGREQ